MGILHSILAVLRLFLEWLVGPSEQMKWEREYMRLLDASEKAKTVYHAAVGTGHDDHEHLLLEWELRQTALAQHRQTNPHRHP